MKSAQGLQGYSSKIYRSPEEEDLEKEGSQAKALTPRVFNLAS